MIMLGIYTAGVLAAVALLRVRPPRWFVNDAIRLERALSHARPGVDTQRITDVTARVIRVQTFIVALSWPIWIAALVLDAPGIAWRRYRHKP